MAAEHACGVEKGEGAGRGRQKIEEKRMCVCCVGVFVSPFPFFVGLLAQARAVGHTCSTAEERSKSSSI